MAGRPPYDAPFSMGDLPRSVGCPVFTGRNRSIRWFNRLRLVNLSGFSPAETVVRGGRGNPITAALKVSGATLSTPRDFRMVGADGKRGTPLVTKDYRVCALNDSVESSPGARAFGWDPVTVGRARIIRNRGNARLLPSSRPLCVSFLRSRRLRAKLAPRQL